MNTAKTVTLDYPIEVKKKNDLLKRIETVTIRRVKAKDLQHFPKEMLDSDSPNYGKLKDIRKLFPLIGSLCDLTQEEVSEIDIENDMQKIVDAVVGNMSTGESKPLA